MSLKTVCVPVASFSVVQLAFVAASALLCSGCVSRSESDVVVYSALDEEFASPILAAFERSTDNEIGVVGKFDIESTKTVGLANQLIAEADAPRCDLFWNNEIMHTVRLQKLGILEPHDWQVPSTWPQDMIASDGTWCGFAARARVLLVNTEMLPDAGERPNRVNELADPKWAENCAMARPLFGTTATHFAVLREIMGPEATLELLQRIHDNAVVLSGNKQVAQAVSSGKVAWGLTDTDDAIIEKDLGYPVEIIYPDQQPDQPGTLRIPNTLAILRGAPHPIAAGKLADFLMTPEIEDRLAMGRSSQLPISKESNFPPAVLPAEPVRWMRVDFEAAAEDWDDWAKTLADLFAN
ncbi:extracellular solute-binding protein [Rhodopirellula sp. P2]|uniref:extracellular solute-binding protein n=1 Tax=Rhodopirellula sp. P2 TaxID=2127060 RepID=UPI002368B69A|nr:extracellular solute-binding protein [Rhodopirellula sp. P2]WDQ16294.1 extracellular solute-binding protein [Rhodopirellula sp. P2]